jgi:hypothetical protein
VRAEGHRRPGPRAPFGARRLSLFPCQGDRGAEPVWGAPCIGLSESGCPSRATRRARSRSSTGVTGMRMAQTPSLLPPPENARHHAVRWLLSDELTTACASRQSRCPGQRWLKPLPSPGQRLSLPPRLAFSRSDAEPGPSLQTGSLEHTPGLVVTPTFVTSSAARRRTGGADVQRGRRMVGVRV